MDILTFFGGSTGNSRNEMDSLRRENAELKKRLASPENSGKSEVLEECERRLRMITDNMIDVICETDITTVYRYISPSLTKTYGYKAEDMIGKPAFLFMHPEDVPKVAETIREYLKIGQPGKVEMRFRHKDGHYMWVEAVGDVLRNDKGEITGLVVSSRDISDRKAAEEQISRSLKEKETLLKEIHHRVKNNLQIISSLLNLQSAYIKDEQDQSIFRDCQNRVRSMAMIHEKLYRSGSLSRIDFGEYITDLLSNIHRSYDKRRDHIRLEVQARGIYMDIDTAIHCGLLLNEIVSNSMKYAFPEGRKGRVWLEMKTDGTLIDMVVGDDGIGMPETTDIKNTGTLGMQLIASLASQIGGTVVLDRSMGTVYHISFRVIG